MSSDTSASDASSPSSNPDTNLQPPAASTAADEALIANLLSSPREGESTPHHPHQETAAEHILAAADKPANTVNTSNFYSQGLGELEPQPLSPIGGNSPTNSNNSNGTFKFNKKA